MSNTIKKIDKKAHDLKIKHYKKLFKDEIATLESMGFKIQDNDDFDFIIMDLYTADYSFSVDLVEDQDGSKYFECGFDMDEISLNDGFDGSEDFEDLVKWINERKHAKLVKQKYEVEVWNVENMPGYSDDMSDTIEMDLNYAGGVKVRKIG